jgi:hypothetical protein
MARVYELSDRGKELEPVIISLGRSLPVPTPTARRQCDLLHRSEPREEAMRQGSQALLCRTQ